MSRSEGLLVGAAAAVVLVVLVAVLRMNAELGGSMEPWGWFAYGLGGLMSLAVAGGLFFLLFYSARHGYDDIERRDDHGDDHRER